MRSSGLILVTVFCSGLGSPFPEPEAEADPAYGVIKTIKIWDEDSSGRELLEDALEISDEEIDINALLDQENRNEEEPQAQARNLVGYIDGSGNFIDNGHGGHHQHHHHEQSHKSHHDDERHASHYNAIIPKKAASNKFPYNLNEVNTKALATDVFDQFPNNVTVDPNTGRKCFKKMMLTEYTDYTDVMTCVHKSEKRCHTTYVTDFKGHQEQKCDEKFEKRCSIYYENVAQNDEVEVCKTSLCQDCTRQGPDECETVYDTVCETIRKVHDVEDDVVNCETVEEEKCENVPDGPFTTKQVCDKWPVQKCEVNKVKVRKTTPETACREEPRTLCAPRGCFQEQCTSCENQVKAVVVAKPVEECDLEPQKTCRHVTKLVPYLRAVEECVDVPQEVCGVSRVDPVKKKRPSIQWWCVDPEEPEEPEEPKEPKEPEDLCNNNSDCQQGWLCNSDKKCEYPPGKVLLRRVVFTGFNGTVDGESATTVLFGEKTRTYPNGVSCDFTAYPKTHFDSSLGRVSFDDRESLGSCWEFPLNAKLSDGGSVGVTGTASWADVKMCVDWFNKNNLPWTCDLVPEQNKIVSAERHYKLSCREGGECDKILSA